MTVETEVKIDLRAEDHASRVVQGLRTEVESLNKAFRALTRIKILGFAGAAPSGIAAQAAEALKVRTAAIIGVRENARVEAQTARQRTAEARTAERERRTIEAATMRDLRRRTAETTRAARDHLALTRRAETDVRRAAAHAERDETSAARRRIALDNFRFGLRDRWQRQEHQAQDRARRAVVGRSRDAQRQGREGYREGVRPVGVAALAGSAAAGIAARRILGAEASVDAAEINARIYGGLSADAARKLRDGWAAPLAEALGAGTDRMLSSYTDALKIGIPAAGAQQFAELATKTSEAWSVPFEGVVDILGTVNSILTSKGDPFNADRLRSVANTVQHLAAKQSTTPEKLLSFLQRGAGGSQILGMSQEAGLAFGSASTSLGNQAAESLFDWVVQWRVGFLWRSRCGPTPIVRPTGTGAAATRAI